MERWPNFFIVGAPRAGTTSLHEYLNKIPDIFMSPIKEPKFFSEKTVSIKHPDKPIRDKKKYLELFKNTRNEKYLGESSTSYLSDPQAPKLIHEVSPQAKIIIILRDPVERVFSHYLMYVRDGWWNHSFKEQIQKEIKNKVKPFERNMELNTSFYYDNVKRYIDTFGIKQVKIIIFEEFIKNPKKTMEEILEFLEITHTIHNFKPEKFNSYIEVRGKIRKSIRKNRILAKIVKLTFPIKLQLLMRNKFFIVNTSKPKINNDDKEFLKKLYQPDVEKLQTILSHNLMWKNFSNSLDEKIDNSKNEI